MFGDSRYFVKLWRIIGFFFYFLKEMIVSSLRVAYDVLTPPIHSRPGVIKVPIGAEDGLGDHAARPT